MAVSYHALLWAAIFLYTASLFYAVGRLALARPYHRGAKIAFLLPGFLLHTAYIWERGLSEGRCPVSSLFEAMTFIAWCLVALHLAVSLFAQLNYLTVFYMPIVLIVQLAAMVVPANRPRFVEWQDSSWLGLHASIITLGYAAFGLAGAVALMYLVQERQLRTHRLTTSFMLFPPMLRLENVQAWLVFGGFILFTAGLLSGFFGLHVLKMHGWDPKLSWSIGVWGMYLVFLLGRFLAGMQGRWMAWFSLIGWVFVVSTFWLVNSLSRFHHY